MNDPWQAADLRRSDGVWPLFVALFLALLTFFIVLVSNARPDQGRKAMAIDSLRNTFAPSSATSRADGALFAAGASALTELGGDLSAHVRITRIDRRSRGEEVSVTLPVHELFPAGQADLRTSSLGLIDRTVTALSAPPSGLRLNVDVAVAQRVRHEAEGQTPAAERSLALARAITLTGSFTSRGAPPATLAVGIDPERADAIVLTFRLRAAERSPTDSGDPSVR